MYSSKLQDIVSEPNDVLEFVTKSIQVSKEFLCSHNNSINLTLLDQNAVSIKAKIASVFVAFETSHVRFDLELKA